MKRRIAKKFRFNRLGRPRVGQRTKKIFIRVANPQTGFLHEPIEFAQPLNRRIQPRVVENFRFFA